MSEATSAESVRVREVSGTSRRSQRAELGALAFLLCVAAVAPLVVGLAKAAGLLVLAPFAAVLLALAVRRLARDGCARTASVTTDGLLLDGRLRLPRARVLSADEEAPHEPGAAWRVVVAARRSNLVLETESEAAARGLVRALGHTPDQRLGTFRFVAASQGQIARAVLAFVAASMLPVLPFLLSAPSGALQVGGVAIGLAVLPLIQRYFGVSVDVGLDGVRLRYRRRRRTGPGDRVVPLAALAAVRTARGSIRIEEHGVPVEALSSSRGHDAFLARLADARRLAEGARAATPAIAALPEEGYRSPAYPKDVLLRVVEDPRQSGASRATAAVALRASLDDEDRARIRVAAETTASAERRPCLAGAARPLRGARGDEWARVTPRGRRLAECPFLPS